MLKGLLAPCTSLTKRAQAQIAMDIGGQIIDAIADELGAVDNRSVACLRTEEHAGGY